MKEVDDYIMELKEEEERQKKIKEVFLHKSKTLTVREGRATHRSDERRNIFERGDKIC